MKKYFASALLLLITSSSLAQPLIKSISWGKIVVSDENKDSTYVDAKVWPTHSKAWDWTLTNTHHTPGIQKADLEEFINEVDIVILTRGMDLVLQVPQETILYAKKLGKQVHVGQTEEMVKLYNELARQGKKVGGVFHSTC